MKESDYAIAPNCIYICISLVLIAIIWAVVVYLPEAKNIDHTVNGFIKGALSAFPIVIPQFVSEFGGANYWLWPRITAVAVMVSHKYYIRAFLFLIITRVVCFFNNDLIKNFVCRERPCGEALPGYSFPSGHSSMSMCFFGILIYLVHRYVRTDWWRILLITIFSLYIILIGISRIWLNAHYLTDVLAGYLVGYIFVNFYIILDKFFSK